jgi:hypothetical protein
MNKQIHYHANVCRPCLAADTVVKSEQLNVKQRQVIENINYSDDRIIFLESETDRQFHVEEAMHFKDLGSFNKLFDFYSISSFSNVRRNLRRSISKFNERKQIIEVLESDEQAFESHSNVNKLCSAADSVVKSKKLNG